MRRVRRRVELTGGVAVTLRRFALDREPIALPSLPPVVGGSFGEVSLTGLWGPVRVEGPNLAWEACARADATEDARSRLEKIESLRNVPASLDLADGRRIRARFGHTPQWGDRSSAVGPGPTCEFTLWHTETSEEPARWAGQIGGGGFLNRNLSLSRIDGPGHRIRGGMRLEGNYVWFLFIAEDAADSRVIIDTAGRAFDHETLGIDFNALQTSLGCALELHALVGLDGAGNVVGCAGVHLGGNRETKTSRRASESPVPDDVVHECWIPVFFRALATTMKNDDELPWGVAVNAYLDSVSDATLDGRYLKLQVALEAFAKALLKKQEKKKQQARFLVSNRDEWVAWVRKNAGELGGFAADAKMKEVFINKVISAMNLPSSGVVADALARLQPPLVVDAAALDEIEKRNIPAHHYSMNKPGIDYEVDRDVQRVEILRSLLAALIARACGYDGALAGWVADEASGWKTQAEWWPPATERALVEARAAFYTSEERTKLAPKVFRSRIRLPQVPKR